MLFRSPKVAVVQAKPKTLKISYSAGNNELSLDLKNDSLAKVAKVITQKSKKNVVLSAGISPKLVNVYLENMPFDNALEKLGVANNLTITKTEDGVYLIEKSAIAANSNTKGNNRNNRSEEHTSELQSH